MELYLLRHAKAEPRTDQNANDSKRPLTKEGAKTQRAVNKGISALKLKFDCILSSPYVRSKQTAENVAEHLETKMPRYTKHLAPKGDIRALIDEIMDHHSSSKSILLVGHEPDLSHLLSLLVCGSEKLQLSLKKSGLCKITAGELRFGKCAQLDWVLTPKHLEMIGQ